MLKKNTDFKNKNFKGRKMASNMERNYSPLPIAHSLFYNKSFLTCPYTGNG